eukprot:2537041-Pleurochrysis_carterae.AAC.1
MAIEEAVADGSATTSAGAAGAAHGDGSDGACEALLRAAAATHASELLEATARLDACERECCAARRGRREANGRPQPDVTRALSEAAAAERDGTPQGMMPPRGETAEAAAREAAKEAAASGTVEEEVKGEAEEEGEGAGARVRHERIAGEGADAEWLSERAALRVELAAATAREDALRRRGLRLQATRAHGRRTDSLARALFPCPPFPALLLRCRSSALSSSLSPAGYAP